MVDEKLLTPGVNPVESTVPDSFKDKNVASTTMKKLSNVIKEKLEGLKDLATLELRMPVEARMRTRLKSIQSMGKAMNLKIEGHWKTTPPEHHISKLQARKISNEEAQIKFEVYEVDSKGNKRLYEHTAKEKKDGVERERVISAEYRIAYEVTEYIRRNKPITREIVEVDNNR